MCLQSVQQGWKDHSIIREESFQQIVLRHLNIHIQKNNQLIFDKGAKAIQWSRVFSTLSDSAGTGPPGTKKRTQIQALHTSQKPNS